MKKLLYILIFCFITIPLVVKAQVKDNIEKAYSLYNDGQLVEAASVIDDVVISPEGDENKVAWHIRGFIYKDIYIKFQQGDHFSPARDEAVESHKNCILKDKEGTLVEQSKNAIKYLSVSYYNDAIEIMDARDSEFVETANDLYDKYKELSLYLSPSSEFKEQDIEYYLAMSTSHRKIYERDRVKNDKHWQMSNDYLKKVLELDPENWPALYSTSVSYYNKGAYNLERLPEAQGITDIYRIEAESMRSIEIALPYMMKAYEINPEKIEAVKGLKTILFNLDMQQESEEMHQEQLKLEKRD